MVQKNEAGDLSSAWDGRVGPEALPLRSPLALAASSFHTHLSVSWDLGKMGPQGAGLEEREAWLNHWEPEGERSFQEGRGQVEMPFSTETSSLHHL